MRFSRMIALAVSVALIALFHTSTAQAQIGIDSISELQLIGNDPGYSLDGAYVLTQDIDASDSASWNGGQGFSPIGGDAAAFTGTFDGQGHRITGLTINRPETTYVGLFGIVGSGGSVSNLSLEGGSISGDGFVGGLAGRCHSPILNCTNTGTVSGSWLIGGLAGQIFEGAIASCSSSGSVSGTDNVGGLVGHVYGGTLEDSYSSSPVTAARDNAGGLVGFNQNYGNGAYITNCFATGIVTGGTNWASGGLVGENAGWLSDSYATGAVSGAWMVGGLVGRNNLSILRCFATGAVSGTNYSVGGLLGENFGTVEDSYATGAVTGLLNGTGGLVGWNQQGAVLNSYSTGPVTGPAKTGTGGLVGISSGAVDASFWNVQTSGQTISAGGTGCTTAQMRQESTYTDAGWSFTATWAILPAGGYPFLLWTATDSDSDGVYDYLEGSGDFDNDGTPNNLDSDSDNDGISDSIEGSADIDHDGSPNFIDLDSDGDGMSDLDEGTADPDFDGSPNYLDKDSDGDGVSDAVEAGWGTDPYDPLSPEEMPIGWVPLVWLLAAVGAAAASRRRPW